MGIEGVLQVAGAAAVAADRSAGSTSSQAAPRQRVAAPAPAVTASSGAGSSAPDVAQSLHQQLAVINRILEEGQRNLSFSVDQTTGKTVVRVVRAGTGEVVRQIPSEEALVIAASLAAGNSLTSLGVEKWS
jgi:flagellar protein FlaG